MRRRGAALPVALLLLALLGALAGLVLVASRVRVLAGARALDHARLEAAARGAIEWHLFQWGQVHPDTLAVGATAPLVPPAWAGVPLAGTLTRTGQAGFLLAVTAERRAADGGILARSSAGQLVRLTGAASPDTAALVAFGPVTLLDSARVSGFDSLPATSWAPACPPPSPPQPGVRSRLATADCPGGGCVAGAPPLLQDSAVAPAATYPLVVAGGLAVSAAMTAVATGSVRRPGGAAGAAVRDLGRLAAWVVGGWFVGAAPLLGHYAGYPDGFLGRTRLVTEGTGSPGVGTRLGWVPRGVLYPVLGQPGAPIGHFFRQDIQEQFIAALLAAIHGEGQRDVRLPRAGRRQPGRLLVRA